MNGEDTVQCHAVPRETGLTTFETGYRPLFREHDTRGVIMDGGGSHLTVIYEPFYLGV